MTAPTPEPLLRRVVTDDVTSVAALNEAAVPHVNRLTIGALANFAEAAAYFTVASVENRLVGFLIGLTPEATYDSPNFGWFRERYDRFVYVDRIVVSEHWRGRGIGSRLYDDLAIFTRPLAPIITCEVNIRPSNERSLSFHAKHGFQPVGEQDTENGAKRVRLMVRSRI